MKMKYYEKLKKYNSLMLKQSLLNDKLPNYKAVKKIDKLEKENEKLKKEIKELRKR